MPLMNFAFVPRNSRRRDGILAVHIVSYPDELAIAIKAGEENYSDAQEVVGWDSSRIWWVGLEHDLVAANLHAQFHTHVPTLTQASATEQLG